MQISALILICFYTESKENYIKIPPIKTQEIYHIVLRNLKVQHQVRLKDVLIELKDIDKVVQKLALRISRTELIEAKSELEQAKKANMKWVLLSDKNYPVLLKQSEGPPLILYYKGDITLLNDRLNKILSIVGTRKMTAYGSQLIQNCLHELASINPVIVSGLAYGVDYLAQELAIDLNLKTVQVCAYGLDIIYPKKHKALFKKIETHGLVLSEYPPGTSPLKHHFLTRNRIIAGVSWATLIIESALKGGSLTTAKYAFEYNRPLFCFPGRVTDVYSQGCNLLIHRQMAIGILSVQDLANELQWPLESPTSYSKTKLGPVEQQILELAQKDLRISIPSLLQKTNYRKEELTLILVRLEIQGYLKRTKGLWYEKI